MTYFLPDPNVLKDQRRFDGLMITVLRTALFREIKVCLIGRNGRACSQSFYQENILIIKTFCPFVLLSIIIICSYVLLSKIQLSGRSTGYLRGMYGICLNNISRCSNPLHIDVLRILREMLPSFVKFMINKWNPTNSFPFTWNFRNNSISLQTIFLLWE